MLQRFMPIEQAKTAALTAASTTNLITTKLCHFFHRYRLGILSGILIGMNYIPFYPWAEFFCLTPLFLFWWARAQNKRQAFIAGWLTQFALNLIGFHWIAYTAIEFGHFPVWGGILSLLGFATIAHLYFPVAGAVGHWLIHRFQLKGKASLFVYALTFAIMDRSFPKIFPWHFGYPWLWAGWPGAQFTDIIGFEGLNVVTILVNALMTWAIVEGLLKYAKARRKPWLIASGAAVIVLAVNLAGVGRQESWKTTDAELNVLAIQGNIGNFDKLMAELRSEFGVPVVQKYIDMSRQAISRHPEAQLMIWPETAFPTLLDRATLNQHLASQVRSFLRETKMPLLTGAYSNDGRSRSVYNGIFFLDANGEAPLDPYRKTILLVFGETFPFSEYIDYMGKLFPNQGSFARGSGPKPLKVTLSRPADHSVNIGPQICYEGLYPWFSAELSRDGAQIFANVTNDSWFWRPFEPNQHLYMTLARSIEFRRPLFRSTNTGITTAILASGELLEKSPIGEEWTGLFRIPYLKNPPHTFYEQYGAAWPWILILTLVLVLVLGKRLKV
jgi:apolipoprotein N-acyltransferase